MVTADSKPKQLGFLVSDWEVRPQAGELCRNGKVVKLEPRVMALLQLLASQPGEVFTRNQLEESIWPGLIVGYDALTKSIGRLRDALGDYNKPYTYIETIPKKGYRLIASVSEVSSVADDDQTALLNPAPKVINRSVIFTISLIAVFLGYMLLSQKNPHEIALEKPLIQKPNRIPSIIILPFKNLNNDAQQDYFSEGITDDLITELSGYSGIEVISSRIAFQFNQKNVEIETLANQLGALYVVEGSIRRTNDKIRINVQMIDTRRGTNLWAEQYNQPHTSLFDIQDELRSQIISALSVKLGELNRKRKQKRYTKNYHAYDAFLQGQNSLIKRSSAADNLQALKAFENAIAIDPGFTRAYAALAMANTDAYRQNWSDNPDLAGRIALNQASHALKLDPESRHATLSMGYTQFFVASNHSVAFEMAERTLHLDPNNVDANMLLATIHAHANEYDKAEAYVETGMRLTSEHSSIYFGIHGLIKLLSGDHSAARILYEKSLRVNPERFMGKIYMAITLARLNQMNEAKWYAEEIKDVLPNFNAEIWATKQPFKNRHINQQILNDLRKIGLR